MHLNLRILATLLLGFVISCSEKDENPIDFTGLPPFLRDASISPALVNSDSIPTGPTGSVTISLLATASAADPNGLADIARVEYLVMKPADSRISFRGELRDDAIAPDALPSDGSYSGTISFTVDRNEVGNYKVEFFATDKTELTSNALQRRLTVVRKRNNPPSISNLVAPDTVTITDPYLMFPISLEASDPDGLSDIEKVQFNSFKPDGTGARNNPFLMYDDGSENEIFPPPVLTSGDLVKGDGIYTLKLILFPSDPSTGELTQRGNYLFEFQAFDRSGARSDMISHFIHVK